MKLVSMLVSLMLLTSCSAQSSSVSNIKLNDCSSIRFDNNYVSNTKNFIMPCLDGTRSFDLKSLRGPTIINVWGSWCLGCREEMPFFVEMYNHPNFKNSQVQLVGVDVAENNF
ncbi:MAG: TlpA disulfide reductase family protein, partial [Candidatus Fonsibacter sp.]